MGWFKRLAVCLLLATTGCVPELDDAVEGEPPELVNEECGYHRVFFHEGTALEVEDGSSSLVIEPLESGDAFACAVLRLEMQTPDNLQELVDGYEGCPVYLAIAEVEGTSGEAQEVGHGEFNPYDLEGCVRGADRLQTHNYMAESGFVEGPWPPGEDWVVELRIEPYISRVTLFQDGEQVGPIVEAPFSDDHQSLTLSDTRDPRFTLGAATRHLDRHFPWYGATYANVEIWAHVVEAD